MTGLWCSLLCQKGWFTCVSQSHLTVGHTHEDVGKKFLALHDEHFYIEKQTDKLTGRRGSGCHHQRPECLLGPPDATRYSKAQFSKLIILCLLEQSAILCSRCIEQRVAPLFARYQMECVCEIVDKALWQS